MPRENARSKAGRLLTEGRIEIVRLDEHGCLALVRGDSGEIRTVRFERGAWTCDCPALGYCSHAIACALVVVVRPSRLGRSPCSWPRTGSRSSDLL
jgi:uncharacterized Zn finger protein